MGFKKGLLLLCCAVVSVFVAIVVAQPDPTYDHQTVTYTANHNPVSVTDADISITPFFSPDHSIDTFVSLIENAQESIIISTPGFNSWGNCTPFNSDFVGCPLFVVRNEEPFPVFQALVNALLRGVNVTILSNYYNVADYPGEADPLSFLCLAGATCKYYTTTTFLHTKTMLIDGQIVLISSVNYSYTSFMKNREAGVVMQGNDIADIYNFYYSMIMVDLDQAISWPLNTYSSSQWQTIQNSTPVNVVIPEPVYFPGAFQTNLTTFDGPFSKITCLANPDGAYDIASADILNCKESVYIYIYQITDIWCSVVQQVLQAGVCRVTILVSNDIYSKTDLSLADQCYSTLQSSYNLTVQMTETDLYTYSHQKFWIVDGQITFLSSGNMGATDFPNGADVFPPYGAGSWRKTNRDHSVRIEDKDVANYFTYVMMQDYALGQPYSSSY